jgi:hypothetical protein
VCGAVSRNLDIYESPATTSTAQSLSTVLNRFMVLVSVYLRFRIDCLQYMLSPRLDEFGPVMSLLQLVKFRTPHDKIVEYLHALLDEYSCLGCSNYFRVDGDLGHDPSHRLVAVGSTCLELLGLALPADGVHGFVVRQLCVEAAILLRGPLNNTNNNNSASGRGPLTGSRSLSQYESSLKLVHRDLVSESHRVPSPGYGTVNPVHRNSSDNSYHGSPSLVQRTETLSLQYQAGAVSSYMQELVRRATVRGRVVQDLVKLKSEVEGAMGGHGNRLGDGR